ncbi:MAG: TlpA disulfide reductase family protein [Pyrinomonadaceae bacterium]
MNPSAVNPVVLFSKARDLSSREKYPAAEAILVDLIHRFPDDFEIRGLYLKVLEKTGNLKIYIAESEKALEFYQKVPFEERTETFYENFRKAAFGARKFKAAFAIYEEWGKKFPRSYWGRIYRSEKAFEEKDWQKGAELLEELIRESAGKNDQTSHYRNYFLLVCRNSDQVDREKLILRAEEFGQSLEEKLNDANSDQSDYARQLLYLDGLSEISGKLREKLPGESLKFAEKGLAFFEKFKAVPEVAEFEDVFREAEFNSYIALKDWKNAEKKGANLLDRLEKSGPGEKLDEASLRRDYSIILEHLKKIPSAREQLYIAYFLNREFRADWQSFDARHPLSADEKISFERSARQKYEKFLASQESLMRANLLKTEKKIPAGNFSIMDLDGKTVSLGDFRGKVLILNFWATWCLPCVGELEELKTAYRKYKNDSRIGFAIVSTDEEKEKVRTEVKNRGYEFPVFHSDEEIEKNYKIDAVPTLFIIDAEGNIRFEKKNYVDSGFYLKELDWMIEAALN